MARYLLENRFSCNKVDRAAGIIHGVSVATVGPAKGHKIYLDSETLKTLMDCSKTYVNGLKVKGDHGSGVFATCGRLLNYHMDGNRLRADLHVLPSFEDKEKLYDMAETIPDTFGLSVSFSGPNVIRKGKKFARCAEIYSADLVSEPAANPTGLFSVPQRSGAMRPNAPTILPPADRVESMRDKLKKKAIVIRSDYPTSERDDALLQGKKFSVGSITKPRQLNLARKANNNMSTENTSEANELDMKKLAEILTNLSEGQERINKRFEKIELAFPKKFKKKAKADDDEDDEDGGDEDDNEFQAPDGQNEDIAKVMCRMNKTLTNLNNHLKIVSLSRRGSSAPTPTSAEAQAAELANGTRPAGDQTKATKKTFQQTFDELSAQPANASKAKSERVELAIKANPEGYQEWKQTGARSL